MRLRIVSAIAACAAAAFFATPSAMAQAVCEETQFSAKTGQAYLDAENAYVAEDFASAKQKISQLRNSELNCYERAAMIRLSAAINVQAGDYAGAARDLEEAINTGGITGADAVKTYYDISQLYLQLDDKAKAAKYLETWLAKGGKPNNQQVMQLAVLYNQMGDNPKALSFLERMLNSGAELDKQTIDFAVYLYNELGQKAKLASFLADKVIPRFASEKRYWEVMAGLYYDGKEDRKAFEVTKAMYLAGFLTTESEIMRIVNFYNQFNAPYEAAKVLEKEMNAGRIEATSEKLDTLANLYQVAREYDRAIPVIQKYAQKTNSGRAYERLGRSYFELKKYDEAEKALRTGMERGGMKEPGYAWILIGQMHHERGNRDQARTAFSNANKAGDRGGRAWLDFMESEEKTAEALRTFDIRVELDEKRNVKKICSQTEVLGGEPGPECASVDEDIKALEIRLGLRNADGGELTAEDVGAEGETE